MAVRLFVGNLPYSTTEADLLEHFSAVGPLTYLYLPTDRESGKPRGFAFVEFGERAHAEDAIRRFNNQPFQGRPIAVSEARAKDDRPQAGSSPRVQSSRAPMQIEDAPRASAAGRSFGPDAAPRGKRKKPKGGSKSERVPKGPIRERPGGQLFLGAEEDELVDDELDGENFASRVDDSQDYTDE